MKIDTWKEILTPGGLRPMIFFNPSIDFMTFCKNNYYSNIPIRIRGTGGVYDGIYYVSIDIKTDQIYCGSPAMVPLQYTAVLNRDFTIIPSQKGSVSMAYRDDSVIDPPTVDTKNRHSPVNDCSNHDVMKIKDLNHDEKKNENHDDLNHNEKKHEKFVSSNVDIQESDIFSTPTPTSMQNCTANSLQLWQVILMMIIIILLLVACFLCYF